MPWLGLLTRGALQRDAGTVVTSLPGEAAVVAHAAVGGVELEVGAVTVALRQVRRARRRAAVARAHRRTDAVPTTRPGTPTIVGVAERNPAGGPVQFEPTRGVAVAHWSAATQHARLTRRARAAARTTVGRVAAEVDTVRAAERERRRTIRTGDTRSVEASLPGETAVVAASAVGGVELEVGAVAVALRQVRRARRRAAIARAHRRADAVPAARPDATTGSSIAP